MKGVEGYTVSLQVCPQDPLLAEEESPGTALETVRMRVWVG